MRHATNWALDENLNKQNLKDVPKDFHPMISRRHFMLVLDNDLKPAFGASEEALASYHQEGMFSFGPRFDRLMRDITTAAQVSDAVPKATILLRGERRRHSWDSCTQLCLGMWSYTVAAGIGPELSVAVATEGDACGRMQGALAPARRRWQHTCQAS